VKGFVGALCSVILLLISCAVPCSACVGRILTLAITSSPDQKIIGQILSVFINERTGTTVNIVTPGNEEACHQMVLSGKADLYVNYLGVAQKILGDSTVQEDGQKAYILVSQSFLDRFKMVWLRPFGYRGPLDSSLRPVTQASLAAPIASVETLRKFPVLDRLINKLGGKIGNNTLEKLEQAARNKDVRQVVKEFLRKRRLI